MDQLYVTCRGQTLTFGSFTLTRGIGRVPMSLSVSYSDTLNGTQSEFAYGDLITARLGSTLVFTGKVDGVYPRIKVSPAGPADHTVTMSARSGMRNLIDCSIDLINTTGQVAYGNVEQIANFLAKPYGITVINKSKQNLNTVPFGIRFSYGQTPWSVISTAARYSGVLLMDDEQGNLVIDDVGSKVMSSGVTIGANVEDVSTNISMGQRFSDVYCVFATADSLSTPLPQATIHGHSKDPMITERRPLYIVSQQTVGGQDIAQTVADWEVAHRLGGGYNAQVVLTGWRDTAGNLWVPNALVDTDLTAAKMPPQRLAITGVTYSNSLSGTRTTLSLTVRDALKPEPVSLNDVSLSLRPTGQQTATPSIATSGNSRSQSNDGPGV